MLGQDLTNTGKEKSLTTAWHSLVHSLVILLNQFTQVKRLKKKLIQHYD
jgi:hypothetical protein